MVYEKKPELGEVWVSKNSAGKIAVLQGVVYDMDGVLVDVSNSYRVAIKKTAEEYLEKQGIKTTVDFEEIQAVKNKGGFVNDWETTYAIIYYYLSKGKKQAFGSFLKKTKRGLKGVMKTRVDKKASEKLEKDKSRIKQSFQDKYLGKKGKKGLIYKEKALVKKIFLDMLGELGIEVLGVATTRPRKEAELSLDILGLRNIFGNMVCEEDVERGKPEPDMLLKAAEKQGFSGNAAYVGDNPDDVLAAKKAKFLSIAVGDFSEMRDKKPDAVLEDANQLPFLIEVLRKENRRAVASRKTRETKISVELVLDGRGKTSVSTGLAFFDHMLSAFAKHGLFDLSLKASGDLETGSHHTVEDVGILLGRAFKEALGEKTGIRRTGFSIFPMDEALATVAVDLSGRSHTEIKADFENKKIADLPVEELTHFFESLAQNMGMNTIIRVEGKNDHHKAEAMFKGLGKALSEAVRMDSRVGVLSTKGTLG